MIISVLRLIPELVDEAAVGVDRRSLVVAVDATPALPAECSAPDVEEADRIEEIAIVFVINDVAVDNVDVDSSFLELEDSRFVVLGDFEGDGSDIEKSLIATSV